jgi:hypothetical protein
MNQRPKKTGDFEIREFEDAFMIYQPERDRVHYLNRTAVLILELCTGENTPARIAEILKTTYGLDVSPEREVRQAIRNLIDEELVLVSQENESLAASLCQKGED